MQLLTLLATALLLDGAQGNQWQLLSPSGTAPSARSTHTAVWSDVLRGMLIFGGNDGSSPLNDLHLYRVEGNQWQQLSPSGTAPAARTYHTAVCSDVLRGMLIFAGRGSDGSRLNDLHLYLVEDNQWQQLTPSGTAPSARTHHTAVWSDVLNGTLIFGGMGSDSSRLNDLHVYRVEDNQWQQLVPSGTAPAARSYHTAVWSNVLNGMLIFGGRGSDGSVFYDLHVYSVEDNQWQQLTPSGTAPSARLYHTGVWSDVLRGMLVLDGSVFNDLHLYHVEDNQWQQLTPLGTAPSTRLYHTAVWSDVLNGTLIFGGRDGSRFNDLYFVETTTAATFSAATTTTTAATTTTAGSPTNSGLPDDGNTTAKPQSDGTNGAAAARIAISLLLAIRFM